MNKRRRVSSDGLRLFNMSLTHPPSPSKVKQLLHCFFHTEYDDRLDEMVKQCRVATQQLLAYTHHKDINVNQLINNSMFNLIHAMLMDEGKLLSKHRVQQNYRYYFDVAEKCEASGDHHSAIVVVACVMHHAIGQFRFKHRNKDTDMLHKFEDRYGTFRNCYKHHLKEAMFQSDYENYLPCIMVLNMHYERHKAYSTIGKCKLRYEPNEIKAKLGMHAIQHHYPGEKMALFEEPEVKNNTELILLAQGIKK